MAPRRRALSLSLGVAGVGGGRRGTDARRHGGSMLQKLTKVDPMASCHPYTHLLVKIKPRDVFWAKVNKSQRGAGRWRVARALRVGDEAQTFGATVNKCPMSPS